MTDVVEVSVEVGAPAERVWAMVADITRMGEWSPETTSAVWLGGATGPAVGARFRGTNRNGGKSWKTSARVLEADPGRSFVFRVAVAGVQVADWAYRVEPTATGCRVTESWTDRRGWLARSLGKPLSGVADRVDHNRAGMEQTLARLKAAAEATGDATPA